MNSKKLFIILLSFALSSFSFGKEKKSGKNEGILRAGFAKTEITPEIPVKLYGYASRKTYSEGVHDPLLARVAVFKNSGEQFVLVSSDLGSFGREVFPVFQKSILDKFNLKESQLFLSAIHSHSSPVLSLDEERGDPNNIRYTKELNEKLLKLIEEAFNNMRIVETLS